jgi:hypothetical protein
MAHRTDFTPCPAPNDVVSYLNWVRTGPVGAQTILMIHSVGLDLTYWDSQIEAMCSTYDVVRSICLVTAAPRIRPKM